MEGRSRPWSRILLLGGIALVVLGVVVFALGPEIAAGIARSRLRSELARRFDASVTVGDVSLGWSGDIRVDGLTVVPRGAARPLLATERLVGWISWPSLLRRRVVGRLDVVQPRIAVERDPRGGYATGARKASRSSRERGEDFFLTVREGHLSAGRSGMGVEGTFALALRSREGRVAGTVSSVLNGGRVDIAARTGGLTLDAAGVGASAELAPLLERISPLFHTVEGRIEGVLDATLSLDWDASLRGTGQLAATRLRISGSPAAAAILEALGEDALPEGELRVSDLTFADGACRYREMIWKTGRHEVRFRGEVGFDGRLELEVEAPLSERFLRRTRLERWIGKTVRVPLRGTVREPRLDLERLLAESAETGIQEEIERLFENGIRRTRR